MRAVQLQVQQPVEASPLDLVDLEQPTPAPGQVLIRIKACGVCHTDLHTVEGDIHPPGLPIIPGHQVVGEVVANFSATDSGRGANILPGERVGVPWLHSACGECEYCARGNENLCRRARFTGFHVNGGFCEWMVADSRFVLPIPATIPDLEAAPLLCAGIIGYRSIKVAGVQPGDRLGLVGFGASAHLAIQVARYWDCNVFVYTRSEHHRRHALELGAAWAGSIADSNSGQLDRAIIFAPSGELVPLTLEKLKPGGVLAINAIHMTPIPMLPYRLIYEERAIKSVANATYQDGIEFLELAARIPIHPKVVVYQPDQANLALADLKHGRISGGAVLKFE